MIHFACPLCHKSLEAPDENVGQKTVCPTCGESFAIPGAGQAPANTEVIPTVDSVLSAPPDDSDVLDVLQVDPASASSETPKTSSKSKDQKHCLECGAIIRARASICPECGVSQTEAHERSEKYCHECGSLIRGSAEVCPKCGVNQLAIDDAVDSQSDGPGSNRVAAGVCGILLGTFGVHKFILGYTTSGVITLLISILGFCFYGALVMHIIGVIEGIMYLSMSEKDFRRIHGKKQRPWF